MPDSSAGPEETEAIGARLATELRPGDAVLVSGDLGAGKTTLIRGVCRALGVSEPVTSPTFTIGHRYRGRLQVSHLDFFRFADRAGEGSTAAFEEPGLLDEYLDPAGIVLAEWAEAAGQLLEAAASGSWRVFRIEIRHAGAERREIDIRRPIEPAR